MESIAHNLRVLVQGTGRPILIVVGKYDRITPPESVKAFADLIGEDYVRFVELPRQDHGIHLGERLYRKILQIRENFPMPYQVSTTSMSQRAIRQQLSHTYSIKLTTDHFTVSDAQTRPFHHK